ncbi:hypothetical protein [Paenibacillus sp. Z6-24]
MNYTLFLGSTDISDLLVYLSKFLQTAGKRVLLVDASAEGFIRYNTPILQTGTGVSEYDQFDIGYEFTSFRHMQEQVENAQEYDHAIVLCSTPDFIGEMDWDRFDQRFIAISSERRSLEKTVELLEEMFADRAENLLRIGFTRVLFQQVDNGLAEDYLEQLLDRLPIRFEEQSFAVPFDEMDYMQKILNQNSSSISIKRISREFRNVIQEIAGSVSQLNPSELKTYTKKMSRRNQPVWGM